MTNAAYELKLAKEMMVNVAEGALGMPCETLSEALSAFTILRLVCEETMERLLKVMGPMAHGPAETLAASPHIPPELSGEVSP